MNAYPLPTSAGLVQQPGHDTDAHAGLEPVRRAHRPQPERGEQLPASATPGRRRRPPTRTPSRPCSCPASRKPSASATRTPSPARRGSWRSTPSSAGCTSSRRAWSSTRASGTTASTSTSRRPTSRSGDQLGEQLGVPNANQQDAAERHPDLQPRRLHGHRPEPLAADPAQGEHVSVRRQPDLRCASAHTIKAGFDMRRRHMSEFQTNRGNGRFNFSPEHHQQPREQLRRQRHGLVPARRAEPDRAGLPAGRRRHPRHRIRLLRGRRLARRRTA